jgi:hypothetical protein
MCGGLVIDGNFFRKKRKMGKKGGDKIIIDKEIKRVGKHVMGKGGRARIYSKING